MDIGNTGKGKKLIRVFNLVLVVVTTLTINSVGVIADGKSENKSKAMSIIGLYDISLYSKINELGSIRDKMYNSGNLSLREISNLDVLYANRIKDIKSILSERQALTHQYSDIQPSYDISKITSLKLSIQKPLKGECIYITNFGYSIDESDLKNFIYKDYMTVIGDKDSHVRPMLDGEVYNIQDGIITVKVNSNLYYTYENVDPVDIGVGSVLTSNDYIGTIRKDSVTSDYRVKIRIKYNNTFINPSLLLY